MTDPDLRPAPPAKNYGLLTDMDRIAKLADHLLKADKLIGFDVETGYHGPSFPKRALDTDHPDQFVCGLSLSNDASWARYIPLAHDLGPNVADPAKVWEMLGPMLTKGRIVAHHAKFEIKNVLKSAGYRIGSDGGEVIDSMLDAYVLSEFGDGVKGHFGLKDLTKILFNFDQAKIESLFPEWSAVALKGLRFNILQLTQPVIDYCCDDAAWCLALEQAYGEKAIKERGAMRRLEHAIMQIMVDVENKGVCVDWEAMGKAKLQSDKFVPIMDNAVRTGLESLAGHPLPGLKLNSTPQMRGLLYGELKMTTTRVTKTGELSTDAIAMESLSKEHPEVKKILELREVSNLNARIASWITDFQSSWDHRVHASYNQVKVGTGRFAADDPPIQQLPKDWRWTPEIGFEPHKPENKEAWATLKETGVNGVDFWTGNFRDFIVAAPGCYFLGYDYSQIELRVLAGESQEPALLDAFANDRDVHTLTAAMMLGKKVEDVDPDVDRPIGKTMNFALLYQMGIKSLAERLGVTIDKAKQLYAAYFAAFSRIDSWQHRVIAQGKRDGYATTRFGRKYTVWELQSDLQGVRAKGERVLTNAPIQGGAADYMKMAMVRAVTVLKREGLWMDKVTIVANLHDALTFEVDNSLDPQYVRDLLEPAVVFPVQGFPKIVADWEVGQNWGSAKKWKAGLVTHWNGESWALAKPEDLESKPLLMAVSDLETHETDLTEEKPPAPTLALVPDEVEEHRTWGRVMITVAELPQRERFEGFLEFLAERPGPKEVVLVCPLGEVLIGMSSMSTADQGRVTLLLGGAQVSEELSDADLVSIAADMTA